MPRKTIVCRLLALCTKVLHLLPNLFIHIHNHANGIFTIEIFIYKSDRCRRCVILKSSFLPIWDNDEKEERQWTKSNLRNDNGWA